MTAKISSPRRPAGRRLIRARQIAAAAAAAIVASVLAPVSAGPASAATPLPDGASVGTAAGSCWEVKQNYPASVDGAYWLVTPTLQAPQQFYCDMTTDGGGWVLVGRGREAWKGYYQGVRPASVLTTVSGTAAFAPAQLASKTIDGLLNGSRPDALPDGIRLKRATNTQGTTYQEARFKLTKSDRWTWTFGAENPVGSWKFDNSTGSGGLTSNFGSDTGYRRVTVNFPQNQGYLAGFAFGSTVTGSSDATSYLWSQTTGLGGARPFTQMWLRPKLTIAGMGFPEIPDVGTPKQEQRPLASSDAAPRVWGVAGLANGDTGELDTEVQAFAQVGNNVYVGGNFRYVQRNRTSTGADQVDQPYLAAFNVDTGELVQAFRPALNGQVKALVALPGNRIGVGGEFTTASGSPHVGFVALDASTGVPAGWQLVMENRLVGGVVQVRGFDTQDGKLYMSGEFTHLTGSSAPTASAWNGAKVDLATGAPDRFWQPLLNGTSVGVDASAAGDRVYFSGYFKMSGTVSTPSMTALTVADAQVVTPVWVPKFSKATVQPDGTITGNIWQLGIKEVSDRVYVGGSEHSLFGYQRSDFTRVSGSITKAGGDFQMVNASNDTVYAGCHCGDWVYENAYAWSGVGTAWTHADKMTLVGAWDSATGKVLQEFSPVLTARAGFGVWSSLIDSKGTLWVGGDLNYSDRSVSVSQWSGGFARFPLRDSTAPTTPGGLTQDVSNPDLRLTWSPSTDVGGSVSYEVLRGNRVVAMTTTTSIVLPAESTPQRLFVRAVDGAGNRSASTPVLVSTVPAASTTLVAEGSSWRWRFDSTAPPSQWKDVAFDDSSWREGSAVLGLGASGLGTDISIGAPSPRPIASQFRRAFTVADPATVAEGTITVIADDGVVVYVNGTEVGRKNLPTGTITSSTYATAAPRAAAAAASRSVFTVPSSLLRAGSNVVAAETHANYRTTPDLTFDLKLVATIGTPPPPPPPAAPVVSGQATAFDTVALTWTDSPTTTAVEYRVSRDGSQVASLPGSARSYTDTGRQANTTYVYSVVGVDGLGQASVPGQVSVTTPGSEPPPSGPLVTNLSTWSWRYAATAPDPAWTSIGYDASAWPTGSAILGFGSTGLGTDIGAGAPSPRPLSAQFRKGFTVENPTSFTSAVVRVIADDGVIVLVNGVEVGRANLPAGTITSTTYATAAPRSAAASASRFSFSIPSSAFVAGQNVVTVQTHLNYRSTPDVSFDLSIVPS